MLGFLPLALMQRNRNNKTIKYKESDALLSRKLLSRGKEIKYKQGFHAILCLKISMYVLNIYFLFYLAKEKETRPTVSSLFWREYSKIYMV